MRTLDTLLRAGLERANPVVCDIIEITAPDAQRILRRANDQFFTTPPRVSETPGTTTAADANGALILKPTDTQIASLYTINGETDIGEANPSQIIQGMGWTMDPTYGPVVLKKFTAKIERYIANPAEGFQLQIYRPKVQRQFYRYGASGVAEVWTTTFLEVLPEPVIVRYGALTWTANRTDLVFDLSAIRPVLTPGPVLEDPVATGLAQNPMYIFAINPIRPATSNGFRWKTDTTSAITIAGVGTFQRTTFTQALDLLKRGYWPDPVKDSYSQCFKLEIEQYPATSALVYAIDLPSVPITASTLRAVFERALPPGTSATIELSTAGTGGPWTAVKHGDVIATKQLTYHVRVTLNASASQRQTPRVSAFGLDARVPIDVSAEASLDAVPHEIQMPFCQAGIGEGRVSIVRAGRRDYRDIGSELATRYPTSKIELDHYIGSRHPKLTRDRWLLYERAAITNREPSEALEAFTVLSPMKALKKKIPQRLETINTVHTVTDTPTTGAVQVSPNISGAAGSGDYLGQGYYMRVRQGAQPSVSAGFIQTIDDNTGLNVINFTTPVLPGVLAAGDIIEIHSAQYAAPKLTWKDQDPADVWMEIFLTHLGIAPEKIGFGGVGQASRSGLPPTVVDRAPGDATTQAKLKVSCELKDEDEDADKLIDELSFIMGGTTVAVGGQFVFQQIYPLRDANDSISVNTSRPSVVFDARDYTQLQTPSGVEQRATLCSCDYGVDYTVVSEDRKPTQTVQFVDADALAYLAPQDVEGLGRETIPKDIARWCYNSSDAGLFLATQLAKQIVRIASTGLRIWSWVSVNAHPELHVGDSVWLVTDQYTDYDPTRAIDIRGWTAYQLIVTGVQAGGRRFRAVLPGLGAAAQVRGGEGTLPEDPTAAPSAPPTARISRVSFWRETERVQFDGELGGAGPLEWQYQLNGGAWSGWSAAALPQQIDVARRQLWPSVLVLQVRQGDGQITTTDPYFVAARSDGLTRYQGRQVNVDDERAGVSGLPTPFGRIPTDPLYSADGTTPLVDTVTRSATTSLLDSLGRPIDSSLRNRCKLQLGANQTIPNNTNTVLLFGTEEFDIGGLHSLVSNTGRITIPVGGNVGTWDFTAVVTFVANATGMRRVFLQQNGATALTWDEELGAAGVTAVLHIQEMIAAPAIGDYFELIVLQTSGGNLDVITGLTIFQAFHRF